MDLAQGAEPVRDELEDERRDGDVDGAVRRGEIVGEGDPQCEASPLGSLCG